MIDLTRYQEAFASLPEGIEEAEVSAEKITKTALLMKGGALAEGRSGSVTQYYVRASGEKTGVAYTEKQDEDPREIMLRAMESAQYASDTNRQVMNPANRLHLGGGTQKNSVEDAVAFGAACERLAGEAETVSSVQGCHVNLWSRELHTINSLGLDTAYKAHWVECDLDLVMKREKAFVPGYAYRSGQSLNALDMKAFTAAAISDGRDYDGGGLPPCTVKPGRYDAVLSGRVMRNILMTAWMEFSGQAMLDGNTIYSHQKGTVIGGKALNIINAPSHPMLGQAWLVDSEGTEVPKAKIVENGTLRTPLYTLGSAAKAGTASTGSAGRIARMTGTPPITLTTVPAIFYVEPGRETKESLIQSMGTGLVLTYSLDLFHSVNVVSGEFSIPCGGVYVKNGKPVGSVSQMTVAGNLKDLFSQLEQVTNDLDFDNFYLETYTIGSPSTLVRGLSFGS